MEYRKILKQIAEKNNVSVKEAEAEMKAALKLTGLTCSVEEFIEISTNQVKNRLYII